MIRAGAMRAAALCAALIFLLGYALIVTNGMGGLQTAWWFPGLPAAPVAIWVLIVGGPQPSWRPMVTALGAALLTAGGVAVAILQPNPTTRVNLVGVVPLSVIGGALIGWTAWATLRWARRATA